MRLPGPARPPLALYAFVAAAVLVAAAAAVLGAFGFSTWLRAAPQEFPVCRAAPPLPDEPVVLHGGCYTSAAFPVDNDTIFCAAPAAGATLRWNGSCVDDYVPVPPPALTSLGEPAVLFNATALRGVTGAGLASAAATATHVVVTVPPPSSAGGLSLVADGAANAFNGLAAQGSLEVAAATGMAVVRDLRWDRTTVDAVALANVDAYVGKTAYVRTYELDGRAHGEARGAIDVQYTSPDTLTVLQLELHMTAPISSGVGWTGPGAVSCGLKQLTPSSMSAPLVAAAAFSYEDGLPYLYFTVPPAFGGGTTIECTFEMAYMYDL